MRYPLLLKHIVIRIISRVPAHPLTNPLHLGFISALQARCKEVEIIHSIDTSNCEQGNMHLDSLDARHALIELRDVDTPRDCRSPTRVRLDVVQEF